MIQSEGNIKECIKYMEEGNIKKGIKYLKQSSEGLYRLGIFYIDGDYVSQNIEKGVEYLFQSLSNMENSDSLYELGRLYIEENEKFLKMKKNIPISLGNRHDFDSSNRKNTSPKYAIQEGIKYYERSAFLGNLNAMYALGILE